MQNHIDIRKGQRNYQTKHVAMLYEFFISAGNGSVSETCFSLNAPDLPNASTKIQELESNNFRAQFANRFNGFKNENKYQETTYDLIKKDRTIIVIKREWRCLFGVQKDIRNCVFKF